MRAALLSLVVAASLANASNLGKRTTFLNGADQVAESYDYVIIGGGTSGLTVADRLTENPKSTFVTRNRLLAYRLLIICPLLILAQTVRVLVVEYGEM